MFFSLQTDLSERLQTFLPYFIDTMRFFSLWTRAKQRPCRIRCTPPISSRSDLLSKMRTLTLTHTTIKWVSVLSTLSLTPLWTFSKSGRTSSSGIPQRLTRRCRSSSRTTILACFAPTRAIVSHPSVHYPRYIFFHIFGPNPSTCSCPLLPFFPPCILVGFSQRLFQF